MIWLLNWIEKRTGKHIHFFGERSPIIYVDGTKVKHCRCGALAIHKDDRV